METLQQL